MGSIMFVSMHPSKCVGAHVCKCTRRPKVGIMFPHYSLPYFLRQSFAEPEACCFGRFAGWLAQQILLSQPSHCWAYRCALLGLAFLRLQRSTLLANLFPQTPLFFKNNFSLNVLIWEVALFYVYKYN